MIFLIMWWSGGKLARSNPILCWLAHDIMVAPSLSKKWSKSQIQPQESEFDLHLLTGTVIRSNSYRRIIFTKSLTVDCYLNSTTFLWRKCHELSLDFYLVITYIPILPKITDTRMSSASSDHFAHSHQLSLYPIFMKISPKMPIPTFYILAPTQKHLI